jgi:uncharacterized phage protein (TIGR02220 family)
VSGRYRKIDPRIWNDEKVRAWPDRAKLAFLFVLTHPNMTCIGAMRATIPGLACEMRWKPDAMRDAIGYAIRDGIVLIDRDAGYIGVPHFLRYNPPLGPNAVKRAWIQALDLLPECRAKDRLCRDLLSYYAGLSQSMRDAIGDAIPHAIRDAIREPSLIQEQEQEQEKKNPPTPLTRGARPAQDLGKAKELLEYVNELAGTNFSTNGAHLRYVRARLQEYGEYVLAEMLRDRWRRWRNDPKGRQWFKPDTLFNATKCASYVGMVPQDALEAARRKDEQAQHRQSPAQQTL